MPKAATRGRASLASLLCAIAIWIGGAIIMPATAATIAYIGNADSGDISIVELKSDGTLIPLGNVIVPGVSKSAPSLPLAVSPDHAHLYAAIRVEPYSVATYTIDPATGGLSLAGTGPLPDSMAYIATDRTGRYLLSASYGGSKVAVNPIGADGVVGPAQQIEASSPNAHAVLTDATNRFVLVTSLGGSLIHQLKLDASTGKLGANDPPTAAIPAGGGPRHLVFSPDARFVYVLGELDATIHVLPWDADTGTLGAAIQSIRTAPPDFSGKLWSADIHLTPDGRFLYSTERGSSTLAAFHVDIASGLLTALGTTPTETQPRGFAVDPSGRYLLAVGQLSHRMSSYAIDQATGALNKVTDIAVGQNPNWVEIIALP